MCLVRVSPNRTKNLFFFETLCKQGSKAWQVLFEVHNRRETETAAIHVKIQKESRRGCSRRHRELKNYTEVQFR